MNNGVTAVATASRGARPPTAGDLSAASYWRELEPGTFRRTSAALAAVACLLCCFQAQAMELAHSTLVFSASGSPQTIAGTWAADALKVPTGSHIDSFLVELRALSSTFGPTSGIYFDNGTISTDHTGLCFSTDHRAPSGCVADDVVGASATVTASTAVPGWSFLNRLVPGSDGYRTLGTLLVGFRDGGGFAVVEGEMRITAFGTTSTVPEPGASALLLAGLGVLSLMARGSKPGRNSRRDTP